MNFSTMIIFWDWNGTLLNDADICVEAMNAMLKKRSKSEIDLQFYQSVFDFPVVDYYEKIGFNFNEESFEDLSEEFISNYNKLVHSASLQPHSLEALEHFKKLGFTQVIISAMEQNMLYQQVGQFKVGQYFKEVKGVSDIYAKGKAHLAKAFIIENNVNPKDILLIGDTLHDKEIADELEISSYLVTNGHHSAERLGVNENRVIKDLKSLPILL